MSNESLFLLKPDAYVRDYVGARVLKELRSLNGVTINHFQKVNINKEFLANQHYKEHEGKFFYDWLVEFVSSTPIYALKLGGNNRIEGVRETLGSAIVEDSSHNSVRGQYGIIGGVNVAHASDSVQNGVEEVNTWSEHFTEQDDVDKKINQFINKRIDKPMIDVKRYREVSQSVIQDEITPDEAMPVFKDLLAEETSAQSKDVEALSHSLVENAKLRKSN